MNFSGGYEGAHNTHGNFSKLGVGVIFVFRNGNSQAVGGLGPHMVGVWIFSGTTHCDKKVPLL